VLKAGKAFTTALSSGLLPKASYQLRDCFSICINKTIMHTIEQAFEYQDINTNWNKILCNSVYQVMLILLIWFSIMVRQSKALVAAADVIDRGFINHVIKNQSL
jgi:hypothetical protein